MHKMITAVVAALLSGVGPASAQTASHAVKVTNTGKLPVIALTTSEPGKNDWGADLLGVRTIESGKTITVEIKGAACQIDLQAVMDDGKVVEKSAVDICTEGAVVSL